VTGLFLNEWKNPLIKNDLHMKHNVRISTLSFSWLAGKGSLDQPMANPFQHNKLLRSEAAYHI